MQKWEYLIFRAYSGVVVQINGQKAAGFLATFGIGKATKSHEMLNQLGRDGWELVGLGQDHDDGLSYVLKRPVT